MKKEFFKNLKIARGNGNSNSQSPKVGERHNSDFGKLTPQTRRHPVQNIISGKLASK